MTEQQSEPGDNVEATEEAEATVEQNTGQLRRRSTAPPSPTPFDHPLSFPLLLFVLSLWFGYDGFISTKIKSVMFNRVMFVVFFVGFIWTLKIGLNEMKMLRERASRKKAQSESAEATEATEA